MKASLESIPCEAGSVAASSHSGSMRNVVIVAARCLNFATGVAGGFAGVRKLPPAVRPRAGVMGGTGEADASTRVVRNVSETEASPVIEVGLDGDAEEMVAPATWTPPEAGSHPRRTAGCSTPRPATGRLRWPSISPAVRSSRPPALQETEGVCHGLEARG